MNALSQWFLHPETIAFHVATAIFYPVLLLEMVALAVVVFDTGIFSGELIVRLRRPRSLQVIQKTALAAKAQLRGGAPGTAAMTLGMLRHGRFVEHFARELMLDPDFHPVKLEKLVADLEFSVARRLERTRIMMRLGPIVGLMTTLIPISPALVALAKGDVQTLSDNLVVAFSTTVVGLVIGGLGYLLTAVRERLYNQDVSDVEYALEMLEV